MRITLIAILLLITTTACAQTTSFLMSDSVRITIDWPEQIYRSRETIICFFALPNGNTTEWTRGKKIKPGDDWHFDIQHIEAQTSFVRKQLRRKNVIVIYLENNFKSWPTWKARHPDFKKLIPHIIDSLAGLVATKRSSVYLNGHSGGGSFIFGYLASMDTIPERVKRISFLDSDYGYDSSYYPKIKQWLKTVNGAALNVFAYNDSVVLYNGKPLVSPTGGTWYRSKMLLRDLSADFTIKNLRSDSLLVYKNAKGNIQFYLRQNPEAKIYHTVQVELNGFIHSLVCGTPYESRGYEYFGKRAYTAYITD